MTIVFIVLLVISQLIYFYFLILQNAKISKFKDLEARQDQLIREMEDTISAYLIEMREENDRLIKELSEIETGNNKKEPQPNVKLEQSELPPSNDIDIKIEQAKIIPKTMVVSAYSKQATTKQSNSQNEKEESNSQLQENLQEKTETFEDKVLALHKQGKSIEEIAKETNKGKTEIELLLKFHS